MPVQEQAYSEFRASIFGGKYLRPKKSYDFPGNPQRPDLFKFCCVPFRAAEIPAVYDEGRCRYPGGIFTGEEQAGLGYIFGRKRPVNGHTGQPLFIMRFRVLFGIQMRMQHRRVGNARAYTVAADAVPRVIQTDRL